MQRLSIFLILFFSLLLYCTSSETLNGPRVKQKFNSNWDFYLGAQADSSVDDIIAIDKKTDGWQQVNLPHTPFIEPLVIEKQWQGDCWYRKNFHIDSRNNGKKVFIEFEGAMIVSDVWINGKHKIKHEGGYLPFTIDITDDIKWNFDNSILVRLNNENNPEVPPGKPLEQLDFNWYGGLYRNVNLIITDKLHITDAVYVNKEAGGGVFVQYENVSKTSAKVLIKTHIENEYESNTIIQVRNDLQDASGQVIASTLSETFNLSQNSDKEFNQKIIVKNPNLWHPNQPYLYTLKTLVLKSNKVIDQIETRIGIRNISFSATDGFKINGEQMYLRGTNRHQEYPYIGYALSDNAQYRDAKKIKDAGFDYIRLSHYPHSEAFMDACDELGLVVMDCIPGWQFMGNDHFKYLCFQNIRDMIRRDRNHPCVVLWEVTLNETKEMDAEFMERTNQIAHEEYPGDQCYTCGWVDEHYDIFIQARQHGGCHDYENGDKACIVSEYGDWEYYAQNAGLDQPGFKNLKQEERTSRQLRGDGEKRLLQQAMNFQEAANDNRTTPAVGDGLWVMYDYNRGYHNSIESSGPMDIFRLPKFSYYFFKSQRAPEISLSNAQSGPMVYLANYWTSTSDKNIRVFSNCEKTELYLNDRLIDSLSPDQNRFTNELKYPPFSFSVEKFEEGTIKAIGFINGKKVAEHSVQTPLSPLEIKMNWDESGKALKADGGDAVFVYAKIVDKNGTVVPIADNLVTFKVIGPAKLVGKNPINAEAGIATILLQSTNVPGLIKVKAEAVGLQFGSIILKSK